LIASVSLGAWEMAYGADAEVDPDTHETQWRLDASSIQISDFAGNVIVKAERRDDIKITLSRDSARAFVPVVDVRPDGTATVERAPKSLAASKTSQGVRITSRNSSIVVINGVVVSGNAADVSVTGVSSESRPTLTAFVPQGTAVTILRQRHEVSIGDTAGPLEIDTTADVTAGAVTSTTLKASGNASVVVARVSGEIDLTVRGNAEVKVGGGESSIVRVRADGNSDVQIDAAAVDANVAARGNATVNLVSVREVPEISILGNADVAVGE